MKSPEGFKHKPQHSHRQHTRSPCTTASRKVDSSSPEFIHLGLAIWTSAQLEFVLRLTDLDFSGMWTSCSTCDVGCFWLVLWNLQSCIQILERAFCAFIFSKLFRTSLSCSHLNAGLVGLSFLTFRKCLSSQVFLNKYIREEFLPRGCESLILLCLAKVPFHLLHLPFPFSTPVFSFQVSLGRAGRFWLHCGQSVWRGSPHPPPYK